MADTALSFTTDIRPLFTDTDVNHMQRLGMDLSSHDDVVKHAANILAAVTSGAMPPPANGGVRWTKEMCDTFKRWMDAGCLP